MITSNIVKMEYTLEKLTHNFYTDEWGRPYCFIAYPAKEVKVGFEE